MSSDLSGIETSLNDFWEKITQEKKKQLGQDVSFQIVLNGSSMAIMEILGTSIGNNLPHLSGDYNHILQIYGSASENVKKEIRGKIAQYFIARNS